MYLRADDLTAAELYAGGGGMDFAGAFKKIQMPFSFLICLWEVAKLFSKMLRSYHPDNTFDFKNSVNDVISFFEDKRAFLF